MFSGKYKFAWRSVYWVWRRFANLSYRADNETVENVNHALYEMALLYEKYKKEAGK